MKPIFDRTKSKAKAYIPGRSTEGHFPVSIQFSVGKRGGQERPFIVE